ncbi:response regulator [Flavobacterium artemisiae]|uniref:Response regulator n=1 Tax=Flavobacterium artemisiae TaxID=2126556 RepID=A0ABW4HKH5_9FLAO
MRRNVIKSIYLVDDDEDDRMIFGEVLSEVCPSIDLRMLQSGQELSELLCMDLEPLPDIIFLNVNMPMKNGFDCLREIRSRQDDLKFLRILMFSTSKNPETITASMRLGADFYAVKPASLSDFRMLIIKVLEIDWTLPAADKVFTLNRPGVSSARPQ